MARGWPSGSSSPGGGTWCARRGRGPPIGIALLLWAPNLAWQAANGWPQLTMAQAISSYAGDNRAQFVPLLWLFSGPLLFPVSAVGLAWILRAKAAAPWRAIGIAALVALVLVYMTGGKAYYVLGSMPVFMAAGAILADRWLARGHFRLKVGSLAAAAALSGALIALLTLPVLPVATFAQSGLAAAVPDTANEIGWPQFVATVEGVVAALPADERAHAVILTNDYSEASPLVLLGSGLPPVYSGHNSYWSWGPPPADRTVVVHVGDWRPTDYTDYFTGCQRRGPYRQRPRRPERRAGRRRDRVHRAARAVDRDVAGAPDDLLKDSAQAWSVVCPPT